MVVLFVSIKRPSVAQAAEEVAATVVAVAGTTLVAEAMVVADTVRSY